MLLVFGNYNIQYIKSHPMIYAPITWDIMTINWATIKYKKT